MKNFAIFVLLVLGALLFGCINGSPAVKENTTQVVSVQPQTVVQERIVAQYVCADGSVESSRQACIDKLRNPINSSNVTSQSVSAPNLTSTYNVSLVIQSTSDLPLSIHNPLIRVINNEPYDLTDLVFVAELYRQHTLINSTVVTFNSELAHGGVISGRIAPPATSGGGETYQPPALGWLTLFWNSKGIPNFSPGTYTLKVLIRKRNSDVTIASDQKEIQFYE